MDDLTPRLRAVCDLGVAEMREYSGRHEYDGKIQDLSQHGVRRGLDRLAAAAAAGHRLDDSHDETQLATFEEHARVSLGELELHRRSPALHLAAMDLACYDRDYAPREQRDGALQAQLAAWPQAADAAIDAMDQVSAPVATALAEGIRGLAAGIPATASEPVRAAALAAHARLVAHVDMAAASGEPDAALGSAALTALMSSAEGMQVDLGRLGERADAERDRLSALLADSCGRVNPARPPMEVVRELDRDHPDAAGVIDAARYWTARAIGFTRERDLVPYQDGECLVGLAPQSRRWAMAMMSPAGPGEPRDPRGITSLRPTRPGRSRMRRNGWRSSARPRCRASPCMRSLPAISRTAGPSGGRPPRYGGHCTRPPSSRAGHIMRRSSASRRDSALTILDSRSASGWRRSSGSPGSPARLACTRPG